MQSSIICHRTTKAAAMEEYTPTSESASVEVMRRSSTASILIEAGVSPLHEIALQRRTAHKC